jgi:hypothetical protein
MNDFPIITMGSGALFQTLILIGMYFYYSDYCKVCGRDGDDVVI